MVGIQEENRSEEEPLLSLKTRKDVDQILEMRWDLISDPPRAPASPRIKKILILASARSGSTFLTEMINSYPGVFTLFEPLVAESRKSHAGTIQNAFECLQDRDGLMSILNSINKPFLKVNVRWWNICMNLFTYNRACGVADLQNLACQMYRIRLVKTIRLRGKEAKELLKDPDLKIISLFRDPRAVMHSRRKMKWCKGLCSDSKNICNMLDNDIEELIELKKQYPGIDY